MALGCAGLLRALAGPRGESNNEHVCPRARLPVHCHRQPQRWLSPGILHADTGRVTYLLLGGLSQWVLHVEGSRTRPSIIVVSRYGIFSLVHSFRRYGSPANIFHIPKSYSHIFSFTNRLWFLISLFFLFVFENFILLCFHFSSLVPPRNTSFWRKKRNIQLFKK
jgi:hypothetical protein